MSDLLHNMSAPPRSLVEFEVCQLKKYMAFNPSVLAKLLHCVKADLSDLTKKVKEYVSTHEGIENIIERPTGFMIADVIEHDGRMLCSKRIKNQLDRYKYTECKNIDLLIVVFCSTVGDLYIPNRPLSFEKSRFNNILLFIEEEVNS